MVFPKCSLEPDRVFLGVGYDSATQVLRAGGQTAETEGDPTGRNRQPKYIAADSPPA